ncbi:DUF4139 domain-containing protein [Dysgonomonas sp. 520]|uniref:DUF4139 domain-containing protein n=1 Tax=Dysgonomonas sp. 520 TaxID=2302931 RepID=UPI0013D3264F|nr:DUF4139 domain-containing protein [Dysgonomonas sp. 520]NDW10080.1 mucoidy inhibitor MuiA family protein [Dysgonomonas sp. 520]
MKTKFLFTSLFLLCISAAFAQNEETAKTIKSKLSEATVFLRGAELTHTATTNLAKGDNELKIEGLSPNIDRNSLKIRATNGAIVSAFDFSVDDFPLTTPNETKIKTMKDSIELIVEQLDKVKAEIKIDGELNQLMKKGIDKNISDTLTINDLMKTMEYYQTKSTEIETRLITNRNKQKKLEASISGLNQRIKTESTREYEKSGVLRFRCAAPIASTTTFSVSYYTSSAQWTPYYDINATSISRPIKIVAKAKVSQTTTVDWNNVKLTLSTASPSSGKVAPLFNTWFLQYISRQPSISPGYAMQNSYSYANRMDKKDISMDMESLSEVMVVEEKSIDDYITTQQNDLNLTYSIDLPYTIPGDGKEQSIDLLTKETSADYQYYCAPKLDNATYLLAEISDWENLNLLSGKANVTYDGTYIGETYINASSTGEKLSLTLGADKRVSVKRELVKDYSSKKTFGGDIEQVFTYKLTVKNNNTRTIKMVLKDQYPKSTNKDIKTELIAKDTTTPTFNKEDLGVVTWEDNLKPGETKVYQISYSVKYPKDKTINL